jgi:hypothetical protein
MAEEKNAKVDIWALITILLILVCLAASFWATNTATQTRFDLMQMEIRNLNTATHNEIRSVQRAVLENREMIRDIDRKGGGSGAQ